MRHRRIYIFLSVFLACTLLSFGEVNNNRLAGWSDNMPGLRAIEKDLYHRYGDPKSLAKITEALSVPEVGSTQLFWAYAQGFFQGYYQITATCQAIGDNCYVFTEDPSINDVIVSHADPNLVYAASNSGVFKSIDAGATWVAVIYGLPEEISSGAGPEEQHRAAVYCITSPAIFGGDMDTAYVGTQYGVFRTTDGGEKWSERSYRLPADDGGNKTPVYKIIIDPQDRDILYAATEAGVYYTVDAKRWINISYGIPYGEGVWDYAPVNSIDLEDSVLYLGTNYGIYYGMPEKVGSTFESNWMPIGDAIVLTKVDTATTADELVFLIDSTSSVEVNENVTVVDNASGAKWFSTAKLGVGDLEESLICRISNDNLFYHGTLDDSIDYSIIDLTGVSGVSNMGIGISDILVESDTIYIVSAADLMTSTDNGQTWTAEGLDSLVVNGVTVANSEIYVTTDFGVYKKVADTWTKISPQISDGIDGGVELVDIKAKDIEFASDGSIYIGAYLGGVLKSVDGDDSFTPINIGLSRKSVSNESITALVTAIDRETPADPTRGIYELVTGWFGELPDLDGDPKFTILLMDIDDEYYLSTGGGTYIGGYFTSNNEYTKYYKVNSNAREMIYIDVDPQSPEDAVSTVAHELQHMIHYNYDTDEDTWLNEGLSTFAEFVTGYGGYVSGVAQFSRNNSLTVWGDVSPITSDYIQVYLMTLYLYEKYLTEDPTVDGANIAKSVKAIVADTSNGTTSIDMVLDAAGITKDFVEIFTDWCLAGLLDIESVDFHDGIYGFDNIQVTVGGNPLMWGLGVDPGAPYGLDIPIWGSNYWYSTSDFSPGLQNDIVFNGDNDASVEFFVLKSDKHTSLDSTVDIIKFDLDEENEGSIDVTDFGEDQTYHRMAFVGICTSAEGIGKVPIVISDDVAVPSFVGLTVSQNPLDSRYLDLYAFSDEQLYVDGAKFGSIKTGGSTTLEGPEVTLSVDGEFVENINLNPFSVNVKNSDFGDNIYKKTYTLEESGSISFTLQGEDTEGNNFAPVTVNLIVQLIMAKEAGSLNNEEQTVNIQFAEKSFAKDTYITLQKVSDKNKQIVINRETASDVAISDIFKIGPSAIALRSKAILTIKYSDMAVSEEDEQQLGIYHRMGDEWKYVGGTLNSDKKEISVSISKLGEFQLRKSIRNAAELETVPDVYKLSQNYPNPFNPITTIEYQLPKSGHVDLKVYNVKGQVVRQLVDDNRNAGYYSLVWDGMNDSNESVASGVYFYQIVSNSFVSTKKMIFIK